MNHPTKFASGEDFYHYVHYEMGLADPFCEHQGGGAWVAYEGDKPVATYDEQSKVANFDPRDFMEQERPRYKPGVLLKEMWLMEADKKPLKKAAKSVYHRDYVKTKNKPYRKYDPSEYAQGEQK